MSKGDDGKFVKIQTCVLKVDNICCDGCQKKVKKVLHKIDGVFTSTIDADAKKVTVSGNVDPEILIEKLNKAGKHAELWPAKWWKEQNLPDKLQKLHLEVSKNQQKGSGKAQKGGGGGGGKEQKAPQPQQQAKGFKDLKLPSFKDLKNRFKKSTKTAKSYHPAEELEDDDGSEFDEELDEYDEDEEMDDELDETEEEDFYDDPKMMKPMNLQPNVNGMIKDRKGGADGGGGKGGEAQVQNKVAEGKKWGGGGGKGGEAQVQNKVAEGKKWGGGGDDGGSKHGHGGHDSKNGGGNHNKGGNGSAHNGNPSHGGKKGGGSNDGVRKGAPMGQPNMMGQLGNMHPSMGLGGGGPAPSYFPGGPVPPEMMAAGGINPYQQQQYLQALMMQQQQQQRMMMNGQDRPAYPPMMGYGGYGYGQPVYAPPPGPGPHTMFSDENPNSCSIM